MSSHHSEQMSQRSQVSRIALRRCSQNVFVFVFVFVFVNFLALCESVTRGRYRASIALYYISFLSGNVIYIWISVLIISAPKYQRDRVQQCTRLQLIMNCRYSANNVQIQCKFRAFTECKYRKLWLIMIGHTGVCQLRTRLRR